MTSPLAPLRVLDLSRVLAGPWCTQLLADLGADVIKVERPGAGDDTRAWGPPWQADASGAPTATAAYHQSTNRNKRSVAIDLSIEEGRALVRALAAQVDVMIDNFKPGTLARWGLDPATLRVTNPGLVSCTIRGFSAEGTWADRPGYDLLIQGMGGLMSITGDAATPPTKAGVAVADLMTGMYASTAILAALRHRDATGEGQHIELSLLDTQLAWLANQGLNALNTGVAPQRRGNAHPNIVPYQTFRSLDGWFNVAVGNDAQFAALSRAVERAVWIDDARFATNAARVANRDVIVAALAAIFAAQATAHWVDLLGAAQVPCAPVLDVVEALRHPAAPGAVLHQDANGAVVRTLANPLRFERTPVQVQRPPPGLGEHTAEVLAERLGLDAHALAALRASGAVG